MGYSPRGGKELDTTELLTLTILHKENASLILWFILLIVKQKQSTRTIINSENGFFFSGNHCK